MGEGQAPEWGMQVMVGGEWKFVCPTGGQPYRYNTEREAARMLDICYPDLTREVRLGGEPRVRVVQF